MHIAMDSETYLRLESAKMADNMAERAACADVYLFMDADELIDQANKIVHFITNGQDVAFTCSDNLRKTVSGEG